MGASLYFECYSGVSGEMITAALLDLGADIDVLHQALKSMPIDGFQTHISRGAKTDGMACNFCVEWEEIRLTEAAAIGSDDLLAIIQHAATTSRAKEYAIRMFTILATAEAKVRGIGLKELRFPTSKGYSALVEIVAAAVCLDNLAPAEVIVPALYEGIGLVPGTNGPVPIPRPVVASILTDQQMVLHITKKEAELLSPTGTAILAAARTSSKLPDQFTIREIGMGMGKETGLEGTMLRAMLIQEEDGWEKDGIVKLESNIDDSTGEALGYVMERLFEAGARDVHYMPVFMKKNRPAYQINVVCTPDKVAELEQIIFEETTTIGIRRQRMDRSFLRRSLIKINTSLGEVQVKRCKLKSGVRLYPEYDSVAALCKLHQMPFQDVYQLVTRECNGVNC